MKKLLITLVLVGFSMTCVAQNSFITRNVRSDGSVRYTEWGSGTPKFVGRWSAPNSAGTSTWRGNPTYQPSTTPIYTVPSLKPSNAFGNVWD